jgi:hypothetical protein
VRVAGADDAERDERERWGWFAVDKEGRRSYDSDHPDYDGHPAGAAGAAVSRDVGDPKRFDALVLVDLDREERQMLVQGLSDWGGPADGSDALAAAMGFGSLDQLDAETPPMIEAIKQRRALSIRDWTRALVATEFAFMSAVLGTGVDEWTTINGGSEEHWFSVLRRLQRKLPTDSEALPT